MRATTTTASSLNDDLGCGWSPLVEAFSSHKLNLAHLLSPVPIWMRYMSAALKDRPSHLLPEPPGLLSIKVDPATGRAANAYTSGAYYELFKRENPPLPAAAPNSFTQDQFGGDPAAVPLDLF